MNALGIGSPLVLAALVAAAGCSSAKVGAGGAGGAPGTSSSTSQGTGATPGSGGGASSCVPTIPTVAWTSPYAAWSRGVPTDPSFFPIGVWLQQASHAQELAGIGVNVYVGNNAGTDALAAADLATLEQNGMYAILGQDATGLASIDDPTIIGWWMSPDEPDNAQSDGMGGYGPPVDPATLVTQYNAYRAADPTRPVWLGLGQGVAYDGWEGRGSNAPPESGYVPASDIVSFDIYPYNNCGGDTNEQVTCGEFWLNAQGVDRLHMWSNRGQAVWTDVETTIIGAGSTAGPTPEQTVSEVWLSLIHGANGILYFIDSWNPSFREDAIFENQPMVAAVTALDAQIKKLAAQLNSPTLSDIIGVATTGGDADGGAPPVDVMVKATGTTLYVFAAVSQAGAATASFTIKGLEGKAVATVVGESRTLDVVGGTFSDAFVANGVHIYTIDLSTVTCGAGG
jgi:hypothetical protein